MIRKILMCRPTYFKVAYEINPWMSKKIMADNKNAFKQWNSLKSTIEKCGAEVELVDPVDGLPDMPFTANAALLRKNKAYLSHFKYVERQGEREHFKKWFEKKNFEVHGDESLSFEGAGDALFAGDKLFAAYGFRTEARVYNDILKKFSDDNNNTDIQLILCELIDPHFYHIDTCFCPLDDKTAIWNPFAFREEARKRMENEIELLAVPKKEADNFACNSVVIGKNIITPSRCEETGKMLEKRGFEVHNVEMTEFLKAGGACKCLTLAL